MAAIDPANVILSFDYREEAYSYLFNKIFRDILTPGIYKGGVLTRTGDNEVTIAPFAALYQFDFPLTGVTWHNNMTTVETTASITVTSITSALSASRYLVTYLDWVEDPDCTPEIEVITPAQLPTYEGNAKYIIIGEIKFTGSVISLPDPACFSYDCATRGFLYNSGSPLTRTASQTLAHRHRLISRLDINPNPAVPLIEAELDNVVNIHYFNRIWGNKTVGNIPFGNDVRDDFNYYMEDNDLNWDNAGKILTVLGKVLLQNSVEIYTPQASTLWLNSGVPSFDSSVQRYLTAFGIGSLTANTVGRFNSAFGYQSLYSNTIGIQNSAFGYRSLFSNIEGIENSAFGRESLFSNTTGEYNSAFGRRSLYSNTTAIGNSAFGSSSLYSNTTGTNNSAFGYQSLYSNITGNDNSAFGHYTLYNNTGHRNSSFGSLTLLDNTTGNYNSAFGYNSLASNTTGEYNSAFGYQALKTNAVSNNSAFGSQSLFSNTTGTNNSAFGYQSLYSNVTGCYNSAFGY
jgi:hypothetical protein